MSSAHAPVLIVGSYAAALVMETARLPLAGETLVGQKFRQVHGGKGSNQVVQAARLGAAATFCACIGCDPYGDAAIEMLQKEGVVTEAIIRHPTLPTGVGFIVVDSRGNNLITVDLGANLALDETHFAAHSQAFTSARAVAAQFEITPAAALAALRQASAAGATTILNPAPASDLTRCDLSSIHYLTPNETEARVCLGLSPDVSISEDELASRLLDLGVNAVVFTLGERGALLIARDRRIEQPAFPVQVVDTVGAGDSFNAAFATALAEGQDEPSALRFACAAGSLSTTRPDTIPSYHSRAEVEALLAGS